MSYAELVYCLQLQQQTLISHRAVKQLTASFRF